ncbi:ROK family transcriptional regulator [Paenibacillus sp. sgz5001063]|uniref:ROK family transcriptional regulator n=1 Tax=Paenibacillus sp. sgz5001063 TaxID=3242474 RepID=UPI0036D2FA2D
MKIQSVGTPRSMRQLNELLILDMILAGGPLSRADLSRQTGVSKPTVSSAITHLIQRGLVRETGRADNSQGRKATLLEFNNHCFYVIGVDLGATRIRIALADMGGQIVQYTQLAMPVRSLTDSEFQALLVQGIEGLLKESAVSWEQIKAATFGIPGVVDPSSGVVSGLVSPLAGLESTLQLTCLAQLLPVPVITENDVNLAALAEHSISPEGAGRSLLYFSIGEGTGGGLIIQGEIYRGMGGGAGELANMSLSAGKLEDVLSAKGLIKLACRFAEEQSSSGDGAQCSPERLFEEARRGNPLAESLMDEYCGLLAEALTNICAVIAPESIILGGGIGSNGDVLLHRLEARLTGWNHNPRLGVSYYREKDVVLGAVQVAVQAAFGRIREESAAMS